ncbi:MAG: hypothetical protein JWO77_3678 [Ilumatobacteraceae bacterium]|nr:hypothetical protein [Ilumatobacteraceae bacterium]
MVVLAEASAWSYVGLAYGVTIGLLGGYTAWMLRRGRKIGRQLPAEDRTWSS